jgi:hypothetical protein
MASFMEAMKAAREGKRVRAPHGEWMKAASRHMVWADPRERDNYVLLTLDMMNLDWEIEQPPPKRYTFLEAVAMMEQGKRMRPVGWHGSYFSVENGRTIYNGTTQDMRVYMIKAQWEECQ